MRGRFAPSPTGDLHLGNARTALLAWLQARHAGGRFVVRSEDLDRQRVRSGMIERQLGDLRWLGLDWDEGPDVGGEVGPYLQSERLDLYDAALRRLADLGLLYECSCSRRDIAAAATAPHRGDDDGPVYPGTCRGRGVESFHARSTTPTALRFRVPPGEVHFHDLLQGDLRFRPAEQMGDFVVRRKDGVPAYQLAVVVDDIAMGITHVLRGADLISSTARQTLLYTALGHSPPVWTHVPLLLGTDGERLAKRNDESLICELRRRGVPAARVVGWLAESCNLTRPGQSVMPADLVEHFSLALLPRQDGAIEMPVSGERES